jgi:serine/threonine-protein kinase
VQVIRACSYIWQALQGLAAAHSKGILHRDLKPANLMLEPSPGPVERVAMIDFGFASLEGGVTVTRQGEVVGSLSYMAPERLRGKKASESSDLYSMACILYEILVGHRPFEAKSDYQLISKHVKELPVPPREANPEAEIPGEVEAVIMRALAKNPRLRQQSALSMADDLEAAAQYYVSTQRAT